MTDIALDKNWNYRAVEQKYKEESWLEIKEVYYEENRPYAYADAGSPYGDNIKELKKVLTQMLEALEKPVLKDTDFGIGEENENR